MKQKLSHETETLKYKFKCPHCNQRWSGDDLPKISKKVARHWNMEHSDKLGHRYETVEVVEYGGHHIHGNEYSVKKYDVRITSFDVIERIGFEDGYAMFTEDNMGCIRCKQIVSNESEYAQRDSMLDNECLCENCFDDETDTDMKNSRDNDTVKETEERTFEEDEYHKLGDFS